MATTEKNEIPQAAPVSQVGSLASVSLADLSLDSKYNPRIYRENETEAALKEFGERILDDSLSIYGLKKPKTGVWHLRTIQPPIVVRAGGNYKVFEGRRRVTALNLVVPEEDKKRAHLLVDVIDGDDKEALTRLALHANIDREQLSTVEIAVFGNTRVREILSTPEKPATDKQIAEFLHVPSQTWANLYKPLAEATPKIRALVHERLLGLATFASIKAQLAEDEALAGLFADAVKEKAKAKEAAAKEAAAKAEEAKAEEVEEGKSGNKKAKKKAASSTRTSSGTKVPKPSGTKSSKPVVSGSEAVNLLRNVQQSRGVVPAALSTKTADKIASGVEGNSGVSKLKKLLTSMIEATEGVSVTLPDYSTVFATLLTFLSKGDEEATKTALMNLVKVE